MRVPSSPLICSTRKPRRSRPSTAASYATSCPWSATLMQRNVECGSAATQCIVSLMVAFIPPFTANVLISVSAACGGGSMELMAQNPPIGWVENVSTSELGAELLGGAAAPESSG
eukprot:4657716-Prymnesium_polylepis.2